MIWLERYNKIYNDILDIELVEQSTMHERDVQYFLKSDSKRYVDWVYIEDNYERSFIIDLVNELIR